MGRTNLTMMPATRTFQTIRLRFTLGTAMLFGLAPTSVLLYKHYAARLAALQAAEEAPAPAQAPVQADAVLAAQP
jgi:hypothetical protein